MTVDTQAEDLARQALLRHHPDQVYDLTPLGQAVFRAHPQGAGRVIVVKVGPGRVALARQFRRQRQAFRAMPRGTIPRPLFLDPDLPVMGMQAISGQSFRNLWSRDAAAGLCARAGAWLAAFHRTSRDIRALDTAPMLRWLDRITPADLADARARVDALARAAEGLPAPHAILHGDFHAGNLILDRDGQTFGFDFENTRSEIYLRDVFFFLTQAAMHGPAPMDAFLAGHGPLDHAPAVLRFMDAYLATAAAARVINAGQAGATGRARMALLLPIATGARGLLAPPSPP